MTHPRRWRAVALIASLLGGLLVLGVGFTRDGQAQVALAAVGAGVVLCGVIAAWHAQVVQRARRRLASGVGALARWRVDPATWRDFAEREHALAARPDTLRNELALPANLPANGIEIIVGEEAVLIGDSTHMLPRHGVPEVLEADLLDGGSGRYRAELRLRHPPHSRSSGGIAPSLLTRLTFPVPAEAWRDARRAIGVYARGRPGKASVFHGRGDGSDPEDLSTCRECGYATHVFVSSCPRCGGSMLSRRWARRFGALLLMVCTAVCATAAMLLLKLSPMLANPGVDTGGARFGGTPAQAFAIWAILAAVLVFGATGMGLGAWQLATGKRNLRAAGVMLAIFMALALVAQWMVR